MNQSVESDYNFKCIVIGDSGSGKSSLTVRLSEDIFYSDYASTIAIDFRMHFLNYQGKGVKLQIWDTAGQERFLSVSSAFYRGANGVLLCFDLTNRSSFDHLHAWLDRIKMQALPGIPIVLVGCKLDDAAKNRAVKEEEAGAWARAHGMAYVETSAKTKDNVEFAFHEITRLMMEDLKNRAKNSTGANGSATTTGPRPVGLAPAPGRPGAGPGSRRQETNDGGGCPC
jgi:small GTP-binding protein